MIDLNTLQQQHKYWRERNFPDSPDYHPVLGMGEELGEFNHAILKAEQGIRGTQEEHMAAAQDALGDIVVYMTDVCNRYHWDLETIIRDTFAQVHQRDWVANKLTGATSAVGSVHTHPTPQAMISSTRESHSTECAMRADLQSVNCTCNYVKGSSVPTGNGSIPIYYMNKESTYIVQKQYGIEIEGSVVKGEFVPRTKEVACMHCGKVNSRETGCTCGRRGLVVKGSPRKWPDDYDIQCFNGPICRFCKEGYITECQCEGASTARKNIVGKQCPQCQRYNLNICQCGQ